jgi:hypothetical protein
MMATAHALWLCAPLAASVVFAALAPCTARRAPKTPRNPAPHPRKRLLRRRRLAGAGACERGRPVGAPGRLCALVRVPAFPEATCWAARVGSCTAMLELQVLAIITVRWGRGRPLVRAWRTAGSVSSSLIVVPDERPVAFTLHGWPGRIVATQGLLQSLDTDERRVVLAHEQAHLDDPHDLHLSAAALSAVVNPLLVGISRAVRLGLSDGQTSKPLLP